MKELSIPTDVQEISPNWLAAILSRHLGIAPVSILKAESLTESGGLTGQVARLQIDWGQAKSPSMPNSIIIKLPPKSDHGRAVVSALRLFDREIAFYRDVAPKVEEHLPRCFGWDSDNNGAAALLLEDLQAATRGDQLSGWRVEEIDLAIGYLANFHGRWWQRRELDDFRWMPRWNDAQAEAALNHALQAGLPNFLQRFGNELPEGIGTTLERLQNALPKLLSRFAERPHTICHGDFRPDNLMFFEGPPMEMAVIDWQLSCRGRGMFDLAYLLSQGGQSELRRQHETAWLKDYWSRLSAKGIIDYSLQTCEEDYRLSVFYSLCYPAIAGGTLPIATERDRSVIVEATRRGLSAVKDLGADKLL